MWTSTTTFTILRPATTAMDIMASFMMSCLDMTATTGEDIMMEATTEVTTEEDTAEKCHFL
jgi:hypothetical protein